MKNLAGGERAGQRHSSEDPVEGGLVLALWFESKSNNWRK
jgi:hypothetical protein